VDKGFKVPKAREVRKGLRVHREDKDFRVEQGLRVLKVHKGDKDFRVEQGLRVLKVRQEDKDSKVLVELPVLKEQVQQDLKVLKVQKVHKVLRVPQVFQEFQVLPELLELLVLVDPKVHKGQQVSKEPRDRQVHQMKDSKTIFNQSNRLWRQLKNSVALSIFGRTSERIMLMDTKILVSLHKNFYHMFLKLFTRVQMTSMVLDTMN
jgi:hypothetical protein